MEINDIVLLTWKKNSTTGITVKANRFKLREEKIASQNTYLRHA